jgi:hypothetical protein
MKKLLALVAILGLSVAFVGCEAKKPEPKKDAAPTTPPVEAPKT